MRSINVLSVGADSEFLDTLSARLSNENEDLNITSTQRVSEALNYISNSHQGVECVVSRCKFPDEDEVDFLKAARSEDPDLPIIVFRMEKQGITAQDVLAGGATDYLQTDDHEAAYTLLATRIEAYVEQYPVDHIGFE